MGVSTLVLASVVLASVVLASVVLASVVAKIEDVGVSRVVYIGRLEVSSMVASLLSAASKFPIYAASVFASIYFLDTRKLIISVINSFAVLILSLSGLPPPVPGIRALSVVVRVLVYVFFNVSSLFLSKLAKASSSSNILFFTFSGVVGCLVNGLFIANNNLGNFVPFCIVSPKICRTCASSMVSFANF